MEHKRFISTAQAGDMLSVTSETIRQWASAGRLPGRRIGRHWKIELEAVEALLK